MPVQFGPYELQALVGKGGMAEVFRAQVTQGPRAGQTVAIKRLLPQLASDKEYVELFTAEAELTRRLKHPNIVEVFDTGAIGGQYFIAMDYIDGRDLGLVLRRCRDRHILLPTDFAVFLVVTLLEALAHAHAMKGEDGTPLGIVHCDISPSNLFVSRIGEVKLGDFGIARVKTRDSDSPVQVWGKPYYLSPEMIDGQVEPSADLWAAAATLYELLCNERPFRGADPGQVMDAIKRAEPTPIRSMRPEVSEDLEDVVVQGLSRARAVRFPDAASFIAALAPHYDERIGNPMAIAAVVRGLFGA
ncbi:MAG: serine/threonine-protein kinase [Myxococcales bacterium]